jgi:hypothetical protein
MEGELDEKGCEAFWHGLELVLRVTEWGFSVFGKWDSVFYNWGVGININRL